jgi:PAS domain S-box-containing protein
MTNSSKAKSVLSIKTAQPDSQATGDKKEARISLKAERQLFYDLFMQAPVAIAIFRGSDFVIELANPTVCVFWGRKLKDVINKPLFEALPEAAGQGFEKILQNVMVTGKPFKANEVSVNLLRKGQQEKVYFNFVYQPLYELNRVISGVVVVANEITEQVLALQETKKLAEQILQQAEVFDTALTAITDYVYSFDTSGRFTYSNQPLLDLLDIKLEQIVGKNFYELPYPKKLATVPQKQIEKVIKTGKPVIDETRYVSPSGHEGFYEYIFRPVLGVDGEVEVVVGSTRDVTERKQSADALQRQLRVTKTITDTAAACLYMIDGNGLVTFMNPAAEKVTGYTTTEAIGKTMHSLIHHSHPDGSPFPESECPLVKTYKFGMQSPLYEDVYFRKNGTQFSVHISATPIPGKEVPRASVIEFRDITEEKIYQHEQQQLLAVTEQRNALLKLSKTKDEFIALASHQLRTPATAVKQYISLLIDEYGGPISAEQNQYLQVAYNSNERQLKIINDLLKTAQIDSGKFALDKKQHNVVKIVQESIRDMQVAFDSRNQSIKFVSTEKVIKAPVDVMELKLAFINLLENASKYSYPGSVIRASVQRKDGYLEVSIADKGVGISKENRQRIFDKFTRVDNDLSDTVAGTGLGLYWVKQIVEMHHGSVRLTTEPGQGSKFTIRLPL